MDAAHKPRPRSPLSRQTAKATTWQRNLPPLSPKLQPAQQRATDTFEAILDAAAFTLADVGIERLSTNLVCEHAGLTPPALYRYFPNKYALLSELGGRLMQLQNVCVEKWITEEHFLGPVAELQSALEGLLLDTFEVTRRTTGGVWIMRALRAVPPLQQVRLDSHREMTEKQAALLGRALPHAEPAHLKLVCRIVVELVYAAVEMLFDEDLDPPQVASIVASMMSSQLEQLVSTQQKAKNAN